MTNRPVPQSDQSARRNRIVGLVCAGLFVSMIGAAYAAVPLYQLFCQVTGYGGTTQRAEAESDVIIDREITVRLDGNVNPALNWSFKPKIKTVKLKMGETAQMVYLATNDSDRRTIGTSVFNVTPNEAGSYFNKIQCFCFTEQPLEAGETAEMPVVFFVDPEMAKDPNLTHVKEITLSYTFYPVEEPVKPVAARAQDGPVAEDRL